MIQLIGDWDSENYKITNQDCKKSHLKQQIDYDSRKRRTSTQKHLLEAQNGQVQLTPNLKTAYWNS